MICINAGFLLVVAVFTFNVNWLLQQRSKNNYDTVEKKQRNNRIAKSCAIFAKLQQNHGKRAPCCTIIKPASVIRLLPQFVVAFLLLLGGATIFTISFPKTEEEEEERNQKPTRR